MPENLYLATELTVQTSAEQLTLASNGLAMPETMVKPSRPEPIFAILLQVENVHQLIELLITKCQQAQWRSPLELRWPETTAPGDVGGGDQKYSFLYR